MALALKGFVERMGKRRENQAGADRKTEDVHENIFESSAVKYCMTNTTVFFKRFVVLNTYYHNLYIYLFVKSL